jgi:hypothetical protein
MRYENNLTLSIRYFRVHKFSPQITIARRFNKTSSPRNAKIERQWREANLVSKKWVKEFKLLMDFEFLSTSDALDLYSLTETYHKAVEANFDAHYRMMQNKKKNKSTKDPDYPKGTRRRLELWHGFEKYISPVTDVQMAEVRRIGESHNGTDTQAAWEIDPIDCVYARTQRNLMIDMLNDSGAKLHQLYVAHRAFTRFFLQLIDCVLAATAAMDACDRLNHEIQQLEVSVNDAPLG